MFIFFTISRLHNIVKILILKLERLHSWEWSGGERLPYWEKLSLWNRSCFDFDTCNHDHIEHPAPLEEKEHPQGVK